MKKLVSILLSFVLIFSLLPFTHVSANSLQKEMQAMVAQGIITGYSNGDLAPNDYVNRGQFATFLARALKLPNGENRFTDVPKNSSLASGINAAASAGLITGYTATKFGPNDAITREQMAIMIDRALSYLKIGKKIAEITFVDRDSIKATSAVANMVGHQIILGSQTTEGLKFNPTEKATRAHAAAFIYRMLAVNNQNDPSVGLPEEDKPIAPTDPVTPEKPDSPSKVYPFAIGTINQKSSVTPSLKTYKTFQEANAAFTNDANQVILHNNKIIKMNKGIVVAKAPASGSATNVYQSNLKTLLLGVMYGSEMEYVTSDDSKITVKVAGQIGYVNQSDAYLQPEVTTENRSYYVVDAQRNLKHYIYNPVTKQSASYIYGKAPVALAAGEKYYSWDGATFVKEDGTEVGTFYQYFNVLPYRTATNYSAAELDAIIMKKLQYVESLYKNNPKGYAKYKDATKKSKLLGLGSILKDFEKYHKINALMVLSKAVIESDYGMSTNAQTKNNLFGIKVYDSNPSAGSVFKTTRDCVAELVNQYLNKKYVPVDGMFANSGILGNKARGVNVRYATDPNWGQKISGTMYSLDKEMGGKDFENNPSPYQIYESTASMNVYSKPEAQNANKIYTYSKEGFVFAVTSKEERADYTWYQILSDSNTDLYGYIVSKYAHQLPIAK
ncbi:S-layer homology domain-containing protein [Bacillus massiliigorillae]|uniref:S-layer homology domain-containing protein n=1 Tax=Bacillus massiliigorillae TaxID=1243664 RepID=UPI0003A10294|nr:S-layer homology domain-containing protein [Bacillus massiliigorillae]